MIESNFRIARAVDDMYFEDHTSILDNGEIASVFIKDNMCLFRGNDGHKIRIQRRRLCVLLHNPYPI